MLSSWLARSDMMKSSSIPTSSFAKNVQFYRKLGYRVDREEEFKGGFAVHMSKPVPASGGVSL